MSELTANIPGAGHRRPEARRPHGGCQLRVPGSEEETDAMTASATHSSRTTSFRPRLPARKAAVQRSAPGVPGIYGTASSRDTVPSREDGGPSLTSSRDGVRAASGRAARPDGAAGVLAADQNQGRTTSFRCGGCGVTSEFAQREQQYGRLVHSFLDQHGQCGNAVEISAGRQSRPTGI